MLTFWLNQPISIRLTLIVLVGLLVAALANWAIYTLAFFPRPISPWGAAPAGVARRTWLDRLPVVGWLRLRREAEVHGRGFWVRPLLIELLVPLVLVSYYGFLSEDWGVIDPFLADQAKTIPLEKLRIDRWMNFLFLCHVPLLGLMIAATFIDFDEQTVPDWITVPGTILGLVLASFGLQLFLPFPFYTSDGIIIRPTLLNAPAAPNPDWLGPAGLWLAWGLYSAWCFALADRRLILRRGLSKAVQYFFAGLVRYSTWKLLLTIWLVGLAGIWAIHNWGGDHWRGLLTSLMGMAIGGGSVWAVRLVAGVAMRQEAMGFGDVTLMAMIGAFVGWQASLLAFVLAPMTAILIVLVQFVLTRNRVTAFGPYLCAGTIVTILAWTTLWNEFGETAFGLGAILPALLITLLILMGAMLAIWRAIKEAILSR